MANFCKTLPVHHCSSGDFNKRKVAIIFTVNVEFYGNGSSSKQISCQLSREDEPLFLYLLRITEQDFHSLKAQQNLLVDFANFPQYFINLLESVAADEEKSDKKFLLYFNENSNDVGGNSVLEVVESNPFKHLVHLSLKFVQADDKQIKKHLSDAKRIHLVEKNARNIELDFKRKLQEKDEIINKQVQSFDAAKTDYSLKYEKFREELESEKRRGEDKLREVQFENQRLSKENLQIERLQRDVSSLKDENEEMKKTERQLQRELIDAEKLRNQLETQLQVSEQNFDDKEIELQQAEDRFQALLEQKRKIEEISQHRYQQLVQVDKNFAAQCHETKKGVEIIRKYQAELAECRKKSQTRGSIMLEQEKKLKAKESDVEKLTVDVETMSKTLASLSDENEKLKAKLESSEMALNDYKKQLDTKNTVIGYLNKQISESHLKPISTPPMPYGTAKGVANLSYKPVLGQSGLQNIKPLNDK